MGGEYLVGDIGVVVGVGLFFWSIEPERNCFSAASKIVAEHRIATRTSAWQPMVHALSDDP